MPQIQYSEKYYDDVYEYRCARLTFFSARIRGARCHRMFASTRKRARREIFFSFFSYALKTLFGRGVFLKISRARALCSWTREGNETDEKREARSDDAQLFLVRARFWVFYEGSAGVFYRVLSVSLSFFFVKRIADENNFSLFLSLSLSFREQTRGVTAGYRQVLAEEQIIVGGASL